jgi:flagellar biosynthesis protein FliQ
MSQTADPIASLVDLWSQFVASLPRIAVAIAVLIGGWLIARLLRRFSTRLLRAIRVDDFAERSGLDGFLVQGGVRQTTATLIASALYWMVLIGTFVAFLTVLGLQAASQLLDRMILFIPNIVLAVLIILVGAVIARVVGTVAFTYLSNIGSSAAAPLAALARYSMLIFVLALAAEQLAVNSAILLSGFQIAFGALCLALALAFGFGGRKWAERILDRAWDSRERR